MKHARLTTALLCLLGHPLLASTAAETSDSVESMPAMQVNDSALGANKYQLPQTAVAITAPKIEETINILDTQDAVKYMPSIFIRKRNNGDTQSVMATRVWGTSSSARSLVYADGVLLTALIANNNTIGGPRWGLVAPAEIENIAVMYGPFSAAYSGNSMGAVLEITTRMPQKFEATIGATEAWQHFDLYGTKDDYFTHQASFNVGNRAGKFSFWVSGNYQDSHSQPLTYVTNATVPSGTTGIYPELNKLGQTAHVAGASGLLHTRMSNGKVKGAYDITPWLRAAYTFGIWRNDADASVETYLRNNAGQPTYAGLAGFATGTYELLQQHTSHSFSLISETKGDWDFEVAASRYSVDKDKQRSPLTASATNATAPSLGANGRVAVLEGTNWSTVDLKGIWRPTGKATEQSVSFGAHDDRYRLYNPTYNTSDWRNAGPYTSIATEGDGRTHTQALWIQDVWQVVPSVKLTTGIRYEKWRAYDGYNVNGNTTVVQPEIKSTKWSPKGSVVWTFAKDLDATVSVGKAYRFATPAELYQLVSTGATFTSPDPHLRPDNVLATEFAIERHFNQGRFRVSLFQDDVHDAIISQFQPLVPGSSTLYSYLSNIDHVRARGIEAVFEKNNLLIEGLEVSGSVTYLDAKVLAMSGRASATASADAAIGKRLPNIPEWRTSLLVSYRPNSQWAFSVGGRSSSMLYTTLDNTDVYPNTYQGFSAWYALDAHVSYRIDSHWFASLGCDNVLNRKYFLFHPFPQRTFVANVKFTF